MKIGFKDLEIDVKTGIDKVIIESSFSRVWQHIENPTSLFAVISAYLDTKNDVLNHEQLRKDIRKLGFGYIEMDSGYTYQVDGKSKIANEKSYMIPNITKKEALKLALKYGQESILWKDDKSFVLLESRKDVGVGKELMVFKSKGKSLTYDKDTVKVAFSALRKGSKNQIGRKFAYLGEMRIKDFPTVYLYAGKNIPDDEFLRII